MALDPRAARERLHCSVAQVDAILPDCLKAAEAVMSPPGVEAWLAEASRVCGLGRGTELVLIFLEAMPEVVHHTDETVIAETADMAVWLSRALCGRAINPFLSALPSVARRVQSADSLRQWFGLVKHVVEAVGAEPQDTLVPLLRQTPFLIGQLSLDGLANWTAFGLRAYRSQPHRYPEFFDLQTADAHAALHRERHGTLFADHERQLALYLRAFWTSEERFRPYSLAFDTLRKPVPHLDKLGFHVPDVFDDRDGVRGIDRYRAMIAHMAAHRRWSRPYLADNFSPFQQLAVETFEDARVEALAIRCIPGLGRLWRSLHPVPRQDACPEGWSCIRHRLAVMSRALLDPDHRYTDPLVLDYVERFRAEMMRDPFDPDLSARLGVGFLTAIHDRSFHSPKVWFEDTVVDYRDDNRYLWLFLEDTDRADDFHSDHGTPEPVEEDPVAADGVSPPCHYPEWDSEAAAYRPDWATVYEAVRVPGDAGIIDGLLERHAAHAKQIKRLVDRLKPQNRQRIRHQKEGDELDVDLAVRAMIDRRAGTVPDERVYQSHVQDGRNIAVLLLLDLSQSINQTVNGSRNGSGNGSGPTVLHLSQEAVTLLGWAVDALGDPLAIAGFASEGRHKVAYTHYKFFEEPWGPAPKARLAAMEAGGSTRMGAAFRHAGRYLEARKEQKKLLLLLSDGRPHDIDVPDADYLKDDTRVAVSELRAKGIVSFCITLDPDADAYVADIFGPGGYTVVDQVERLPEKLTRLFLSLTKG